MKKITMITGLAIASLFYSCGKKNDPVVNPQAPLAITDFNPKSAKAGETVMITGTSFGTDSNAVAIKFTGAAAIKPKTITDTKLTVNVPNDAQTGAIEVSTSGKTVVSSATFTLTKAPAPVVTITNFTPGTAKIGETVTITGTAFGADTNFVSVSFGGSVAVKPKNVTSTQLTAVVPKDAKTGKITVVVNGGSPVISGNTFTVKVNPVTITDFLPKTFTEQDTLIITGTGFGSDLNNVSVQLSGASGSLKPFKVTSTQISVIIPYMANVGAPYTGTIIVYVTNFDDVTSTQQYTYRPIVSLTSISKKSARPGELLKFGFQVNHVDFGLSVNDENAVTISFSGAKGVKPVSHDKGLIYVRVPSDAKSGKIKAGYTGYTTGTSDFSLTVLPKLPAPQKGIWNVRPDLNDQDGSYGASSFTIGGKAYMVCGAEGGGFGGFTDALYEYDPVYDAWTQKASFPGEQRVYGVAFSIGNKGYFGTGKNSSGVPKNDFWEYDPAKDTWTRKADFKGAPRQSAVGFGINSFGYLGSGYDNSSSCTNDFYAYNPAKDEWTTIASMPTIRAEGMSFAIDGKGYVGNGFYRDASNTVQRRSDLYMYDPSTNSWTSKAAMPNTIVTCNNIAFVVGTKVYAGLGTDAKTNSGTFSKKMYVYDPFANTWNTTTDFSGDGRQNAISFAIDNVAYIAGGVGPYGLTVYHDMWSIIP